MDRVVDIHRQRGESREAVVARAITAARRHDATAIIWADSDTPPARVEPSDAPELVLSRMRRLERRGAVIAVLIWAAMAAAIILPLLHLLKLF